MLPALRGLAAVALMTLALSMTWGTAWAQTDQAPGAPAGQDDQTPAGQTPAGQTPAGQTPAGQTPAGQTPAGQAPAGQAAAAPGNQAVEAPAAAAPADEHLVQPETSMREPERLQYKPSGFWTSGRPAVGGAYRYRLLGIGAGVLALTAILMVWVVRRHPSRRA